jgi:hypothetical protein
LWKFELIDHQWEIVKQLWDMLKVCIATCLICQYTHWLHVLFLRFSRTLHYIFPIPLQTSPL